MGASSDVGQPFRRLVWKRFLENNFPFSHWSKAARDVKSQWRAALNNLFPFIISNIIYSKLKATYISNLNIANSIINFLGRNG